jgi:hypothetical protein
MESASRSGPSSAPGNLRPNSPLPARLLPVGNGPAAVEPAAALIGAPRGFRDHGENLQRAPGQAEPAVVRRL